MTLFSRGKTYHLLGSFSEATGPGVLHVVLLTAHWPVLTDSSPGRIAHMWGNPAGGLHMTHIFTSSWESSSSKARDSVAEWSWCLLPCCLPCSLCLLGSCYSLAESSALPQAFTHRWNASTHLLLWVWSRRKNQILCICLWPMTISRIFFFFQSSHILVIV